MAEKKIVVDIKESGEIIAETFGFQGVTCVAELDKLLKGLAMESITEKKPSFSKKLVSPMPQLRQKEND